MKPPHLHQCYVRRLDIEGRLILGTEELRDALDNGSKQLAPFLAKLTTAGSPAVSAGRILEATAFVLKGMGMLAQQTSWHWHT